MRDGQGKTLSRRMVLSGGAPPKESRAKPRAARRIREISQADWEQVRQTRASGKPISDPGDARNQYQRDVDRFYYSYYWQRLAEVTQVHAGGERQGRPANHRSSHNRLTHSEKVAQVGRRLAEYLLKDRQSVVGVRVSRGLDPDVVTAAGLAHDLGHPPFGHCGEETLDALAREAGLDDGYEGNAQTLRILVRLSRHHSVNSNALSEFDASNSQGMDLTRAVIAASVKYPWRRDSTPPHDCHRWRKFGYYREDEESFEKLVRPLLRRKDRGTLEAQVMDWADDISYATHDLEDFFKAGLIPLETLRTDWMGKQTVSESATPETPARTATPPGRESRQTESESATPETPTSQYVPVDRLSFDAFKFYVTTRFLSGKDVDDELAEFTRLAATFPRQRYRGTWQDDEIISRLTSRVLSLAFANTWVDESGNLEVVPTVRTAVEALKRLTWYYVIERPELTVQQNGQSDAIKEVFHNLLRRTLNALDILDKKACGCAKPRSNDMRLQNLRQLPLRLREFLLQEDALSQTTDSDRRRIAVRAVLDYISSMTEGDVLAFVAQLRAERGSW